MSDLLILTARALRAFADGFVAVLLPAYLLALGFGQIDVRQNRHDLALFAAFRRIEPRS